MARWAGWELLLRSLPGATEAFLAAAVAQTQSLLDSSGGGGGGGGGGGTGALLCYRRMRGGHAPFWPSALSKAALHAAMPRVRALRAAVLGSLPRLNARRVADGQDAPRWRTIFVLRAHALPG